MQNSPKLYNLQNPKEIEKFVKQKKLWNAASDVIDYLKTDDCNKKPLQCSFSEVFSDAEAFSFDIASSTY